MKPEGYQLVRLKEEIIEFLSEGTKEHLIVAFWEYILYLEITYKILEKDKDLHMRDHHIHDEYVELSKLYHAERDLTQGDFSERLLVLSDNLISEYKNKYGNGAGIKLRSNEITELLYMQDIKQLRELVSNYLNHKNEMWIMFDNLDKGWPIGGPDDIDIVILRCLIDASKKIKRELGKNSHKCNAVVFIRTDILRKLLESTP